MNGAEIDLQHADQIANINIIQPCTVGHLNDYTHAREYGFILKAFTSGKLQVDKLKDTSPEFLEEAITWLLDNLSHCKNLAFVMLLREKQFKTEMEG